VEGVKDIWDRFGADMERAETEEDMNALRAKYLGREGIVSKALKKLSSLPREERAAMGKALNEIKERMEERIREGIREARERGIRRRLEAETIDVTLPGRARERGRIHPITRTIREIVSIFRGMGFEVAEGPEVETDYYNFVALNTPEDHPARDLKSTFYIRDGILLRTETSPVQVRVMERRKPPIRIIAPGKIYRYEALDASHSHTFFQVEGFMVDEKVTFGELKGVLMVFAREMFGKDALLRFRPHFFPFTEPSAEVDVRCTICKGSGCRTCGYKGWIEILGCGMIDPSVFGYVGYDPEIYRGFAFGMGVDRIAMMRFGVDDIRLYYENDIRFLEQF
jgi:phenylalanyl-tRNA synthetase alpha chain